MGRRAHAGWQIRVGISNLTKGPMTNAQPVTRVLFEDFTPSAVRLFYAIGFAAIAAFLFGVSVQVRKYRRGVAANLEGNLLTRFVEMVHTVISHRTLARRDKP